jgi:hypothetical protein
MHFDLYDKHTTALEVSEAEPSKCSQWVTTNIERYGGDDIKGGNHHWRFIDHRCQCNYALEKKRKGKQITELQRRALAQRGNALQLD